MGIWDNLFGKNKQKKSHNSPFLPTEEDPLDIGFAKNFTKKGGLFLYVESKDSLIQNFQNICTENTWNPSHILALNEELSQQFQSSYIELNSGNLKSFKAAIIGCEYLISNTGKILLSENQIKHFKLTDLPQTVIVVAKLDQLVRDVSQGMTLLKNKYATSIPTNITTLKIKSDSEEEKGSPELNSNSKKHIFAFTRLLNSCKLLLPNPLHTVHKSLVIFLKEQKK